MGNFEFKKKFGQNFLTDKNLLEKIVLEAGVTKDDTVVEIGAGKGSLTEMLSKHAKKVYAFEIDSELFDYLAQKFAGSNVRLLFEDVTKVSDKWLNEIVGGKFKLVANLPYYITSPILTRFLKNPNLISLTVMVQEEVADRIIAKPKTKDYGVLTIMCGLFGSAQKVMNVNRKMFYPVPNVDSAVVKIDRFKTQTNLNEDFINFVKKAFSMRRKKLSSNILGKGISKEEIEQILVKMGYGESARAEELSIDDFKKLYTLICDKNIKIN